MLPRVNVVLPPRALAPTGEFHGLTPDERRESDDDGGDLFTGDRLPTDAVEADDDATFRVRFPQRSSDGTFGYAYYDAASLWHWARTNRLDPKNNRWFYEDWMALRARYEPTLQIPNWVASLPRLTAVMVGGLRVERAGVTTSYYDDSYVPPRLVRHELDNGKTVHFTMHVEGGQDVRNYKYKVTYSTTYRGANMESSLELRNSTVYYDYSPDPELANQGYAQLSRHVATGRWVKYYATVSGHLLHLRTVFTSGLVEYFRWGQRAGTRLKILDRKHFIAPSNHAGEVWDYGFTALGTSLMRITYPNGQMDIFEGPEGQERKVRSLIPRDPATATAYDYLTLNYTGAKGAERLLNIADTSGSGI